MVGNEDDRDRAAAWPLSLPVDSERVHELRSEALDAALDCGALFVRLDEGRMVQGALLATLGYPPRGSWSLLAHETWARNMRRAERRVRRGRQRDVRALARLVGASGLPPRALVVLALMSGSVAFHAHTFLKSRAAGRDSGRFMLDRLVRWADEGSNLDLRGVAEADLIRELLALADQSDAEADRARFAAVLRLRALLDELRLVHSEGRPDAEDPVPIHRPPPLRVLVGSVEPNGPNLRTRHGVAFPEVASPEVRAA